MTMMFGFFASWAYSGVAANPSNSAKTKRWIMAGSLLFTPHFRRLKILGLRRRLRGHRLPPVRLQPRPQLPNALRLLGGQVGLLVGILGEVEQLDEPIRFLFLLAFLAVRV